jgi:hypothetical protein
VGRQYNIGLDLNDLAIYLDARVKTDGILAIFIKKWVISGRMTANPEITARITKTGKNLGNWLGITAIRDD